MIYFSASAAGFLDDAIHDRIPADAVPVPAARHRELLAAQGSGATIQPDAAGKPRIVRHGATIDARRAALARQVKREAARRIGDIAPIWRQLNDQRAPSAESAARFARIDAVRAASDAIEREIAAAPATTIDAIAIALHPLWPAE
ncbi:MAG: hypothetical protein AB7E60_11065 [Sphingobium sp.]